MLTLNGYYNMPEDKNNCYYILSSSCNLCDRSHEGKSRLADSEIGLELGILEFDASS
jgi:hypothetical protein